MRPRASESGRCRRWGHKSLDCPNYPLPDMVDTRSGSRRLDAHHPVDAPSRVGTLLARPVTLGYAVADRGVHRRQSHSARCAHLESPAGRQPAEQRLELATNKLRQHGWNLERQHTERPGHAHLLAASAAETGVDAVVACGGDGTINEVVNGLAGSNTALAVIPAGTVNIWAREAGIPRDPLAALRLLVEGERRRVDLGRAGERYFLMLASIGTDSYAVQAVGPALKQRLGRYAYVIAGLRDLLRTGGRPMSIDIDGEELAHDVLIAIIGNTRLYGGALRSTSHTRIDEDS